MSKEKQISEMANIICNKANELNKNWYEYSPIFEQPSEIYAAELYNAGYRKQSEGEWKQTEEPLGWGDVSCAGCSVCGESWVLDDDALDFDVIKDYWKYCPNCGAKMKGGAE